MASKESLVLKGHQPISPQEGRPRCHSASGTLPWLPRWPQKSQRWTLAWQVNKHGDLVPSPTPIPQVPAAPTLLGGSSFLRMGGGGSSPPPPRKAAQPAVPFSSPCPLPGMPVALEPLTGEAEEDRGGRGEREGRHSPDASPLGRGAKMMVPQRMPEPGVPSPS